LVVLDGAGSIREISPSVTRLLAYRRGRLLGTSFLEMIHSDDVAAVLALLGTAREAAEEPAHLKLRVRRADGGWRSFEALARTVSGPHDQPLVVVDAFDVSASELVRTGELPAMQLGGPLAEVVDRESRPDRTSGCARRNRSGGARRPRGEQPGVQYHAPFGLCRA
jgi:PAS domain S-box-containing protein